MYEDVAALKDERCQYWETLIPLLELFLNNMNYVIATAEFMRFLVNLQEAAVTSTATTRGTAQEWHSSATRTPSAKQRAGSKSANDSPVSPLATQRPRRLLPPKPTKGHSERQA